MGGGRARPLLNLSDRAALLPTLAGALVAGSLIGAGWDAPPALSFALFAVAAAFALALSASLRISLIPALAALALTAGTFRAAWTEEPGAALIPYQAAETIELAGTIADDPKERAGAATFTLQAESVRRDSETGRTPVSGLIRVTAAPTSV